MTFQLLDLRIYGPSDLRYSGRTCVNMACSRLSRATLTFHGVQRPARRLIQWLPSVKFWPVSRFFQCSTSPWTSCRQVILRHGIMDPSMAASVAVAAKEVGLRVHAVCLDIRSGYLQLQAHVFFGAAAATDAATSVSMS